jgi:uncharacterized lipoprotein
LRFSLGTATRRDIRPLFHHFHSIGIAVIRNSFRCTVSIVAISVVLGGCSLFHRHDNYYSKAVESRPLDVPPDLEVPAGSKELVVPPAGGAAAAATTSSASASEQPAASVPPSSTPPAAASGTMQSAAGLHVTDSVDHTWQRVGIALERAQVGTISERDETGHSYTLDVQGLKASAPEPQEHHWYTRILHPFGGGNKSSGDAVSGRLNVKVISDGDGSRVDVEGASNDASSSEAARRVLDALRERLS